MDRANTTKMQENKNKRLFLIDSSSFCLLEKIFLATKINYLEKMINSDSVNFFITNNVLCELSRSPRVFDIDHLQISGHMLNSEASFVKEKRAKQDSMPMSINGEMVAMKINNISWIDWSQIWLCKIYNNLLLVSNDKKMLKSALRILGNRVLGTFNFFEALFSIWNNDKEVENTLNYLKTYCRPKSLSGKILCN